jgi:DNA replication licensing factor MCM2
MTLGPFKVEGGLEVRPSQCSNCNAPGPFKINTQKTQYGNYQKITLQESPGSVPPGRVPRYKDVVLLGDLIDIARPGDEVEVTGIYAYTQTSLSKDRYGFPVFGTIIEANYVQKKGGNANTGLTDEEKRAIRRLSNDPQV